MQKAAPTSIVQQPKTIFRTPSSLPAIRQLPTPTPEVAMAATNLGKGKYQESDQVFFLQIELKSKNSTKQQQRCRLVDFLVFNPAFGRYSNLLI